VICRVTEEKDEALEDRIAQHAMEKTAAWTVQEMQALETGIREYGFTVQAAELIQAKIPNRTIASVQDRLNVFAKAKLARLEGAALEPDAKRART
jgi:adenosyl cobinamide kinase/adenosyl cobinamide phosphate guanylyltransferase